MTAKQIFEFLKSLQKNNNRDWFAEHKSEYQEAREMFENQIIAPMIAEISRFDESCKFLQAKECVFRIYRDTRFSRDKTPYKTHLGGYIGGFGGRKSPLAGYYLHLEPGKSFACIGVWSPENEVLKQLRKAVFENYDEWKEITEKPEFKRFYPEIDELGDSLKKLPAGFPQDFPEPELLKKRHYLFSVRFEDEFFFADDWEKRVLEMFQAGFEVNRFLNFTIEETLNLQK